MNYVNTEATFIASPKAALADLMNMMRTMRPAYSEQEWRFIKKWLLPLGCTVDKTGNLFKRIGNAPVLWSSHTDTVHKVDGAQRIQRNGDLISLAANERRATCLGADCTVGVWLMREMILAGVEGLYIFHACEEQGGIGSRYIANKTPDVLDGIKYAIAFDRLGKRDVVTFQMGERCSSEFFAESLAVQLPGFYMPDDGGLFTDTANYTRLIPECTNISVGYEGAHTVLERQSISHALALREALFKIDVSQFVCERNPRTCQDSRWSLLEDSKGSAAIIDGPWDDYEEEYEFEGDTWVKRNGKWFRLDDLDDRDEKVHASTRYVDRPYTSNYPAWYEKEEDIDPLDFQDWTPIKRKY